MFYDISKDPFQLSSNLEMLNSNIIDIMDKERILVFR